MWLTEIWSWYTFTVYHLFKKSNIVTSIRILKFYCYTYIVKDRGKEEGRIHLVRMLAPWGQEAYFIAYFKILHIFIILK